LENGNPLADNREKFSPETVHARIIKTHLEHAIKGPNNIGFKPVTRAYSGAVGLLFAGV
jgi:hypothetical protein